MKRKRVSSVRRLELRYATGDASLVIGHVSELRKGSRVVLACRVSSCQQKKKKNLDDQEKNLRLIATQLGLVVVACSKQTTSGWKPHWLVGVYRKAREKGASVLAESTDRLIRNELYNSQTQPEFQASEQNLQLLPELFEKVGLFTCLDPMASPSEVRSFQTKRGQLAKGSKGGRPRKACPGYKKEQRLKQMPIALQLRQAGYSIGEIAKKLGRPKATIQCWL